ncbi:RNA polymerase sigma factor [Flagellimonas myxillae]|uniref:RNA polymerase sigma factor n=1 Tax=Flagellimonas myxillae TaxID=2942214 RepID=UPI00201FA73E|nr:RNA polymerase sigma factor [Muricauda myxillae]MCL6266161.1 RNA polymerase sigma factor [Muricauda myxillae]
MKAIRINDHRTFKISDADIVERVLAGERELYEILIRRNNQKLFRVIRSYLQMDVEVQDIMQNTYLKAFEKLYQFKHGSQFSTWLIRIGINEVLARIREKDKIRSLDSNPSSAITKRLVEIPDTGQMNPEKRVIRQEAKQLLEDAIDSLDIKYRTVYMLREIEGMSIKEVSSCLSVTPSNVKVRLHRAKLMLKERLYELTGGKEDVFGFGFGRCDRLSDLVMDQVLRPE